MKPEHLTRNMERTKRHLFEQIGTVLALKRGCDHGSRVCRGSRASLFHVQGEEEGGDPSLPRYVRGALVGILSY